MWREIKEIIRSNCRFLLTTHLNPDGDGIGSACAMTELLIHMGKQVRIVCDSPIPKKYSFLDYYGLYEQYDRKKTYQDVEVLVVLDANKRDRIGDVAELADRSGMAIVCIDHHEPSEPFALYQAIDSKACSTGAMVYALCQECGFDLNLRAATGLYVSIICDTGRFSYSSTNCKAHKIADECIKLGVDPDLMHSRLYQHVSLAEIKVFARALQGIESHLDNRVVIEQILTKDLEKIGEGLLDLEHVDLEYIHDFNTQIEDVQCFVLLRELADGHIRVSLRSKPDLDITSVVRALGGGGHANAAGVSWKGPLEEVKRRILDLLEDLFQKRKATIN